MEVQVAANGGGDSGVETEFDLESNDSSMSSISVSGGGGSGSGEAAPNLPASHSPRPPPQPPVGEGSSSHPASPPSSHEEQHLPLPPLPPPSTEDGYLGDCSSDGGNEKNFPLPPDWQHHPSRISLPPSPCPSVPPVATSPPPTLPALDEIEPPAGLHFSTLSPSPSPEGGILGLGYQVLPHRSDGHQSSLRTKMKSSGPGFRSKYNRTVTDDWNRVKANIAERKLRVAANTNNIELLERVLTGSVDVRGMDEHKRTALHFAAAKGYSEVVEILLRHGANPNQKDQLGNTAMHLAACTNHVPVVTLLLRAGTDLTTLDNNGRTPLQLAQAKLKILQRNSCGGGEMSQVRAEVSAVLEMMREYLNRVGDRDTSQEYQQLLSSFSQRLTLHTTPSGLSNDLGSLLESLGGLAISKQSNS